MKTQFLLELSSSLADRCLPCKRQRKAGPPPGSTVHPLALFAESQRLVEPTLLSQDLRLVTKDGWELGDNTQFAEDSLGLLVQDHGFIQPSLAL